MKRAVAKLLTNGSASTCSAARAGSATAINRPIRMLQTNPNHTRRCVHRVPNNVSAYTIGPFPIEK